MAKDINTNINIHTNTDNVNGDFKSLRTQLREAQLEVAVLSEKFGVTSKEAVNAAKKASELKDRIGDAKALTDAFNPDAKFRALTSSLGGLASGFAAIEGSMNLLGIQSESTSQALLKIQSAMALSQSLQSVGESIDSFKQLGAVVKNATLFKQADAAATKAATIVQGLFAGAVDATSISFKLLKGAIVSTGIGALVVVLGMLIEKVMSMTTSTEDAEKAEKALNDSLDNQNKILDENLTKLDSRLRLNKLRAKEAGKSEDDIYQIEAKSNKEREKLYAADVSAKYKAWQEAKNNSLLKEEDIKKAEEAYVDANKNWNKSIEDSEALRLNNNIRHNEELSKINSEHLKNRQEKIDEAERIRKQKEEQAYNERQALLKARGESGLQDEVDIENAIKDARKSNQDFTKSAQQVELDDTAAKYDALIQKAQEFNKDTTDLEIAKLNALNDINKEYQDKKYADDEENAQKQIDLEQRIADSKKTIQDSTISNVEGGLNLLKNVFQKNKDIQKGLILADSALGIAKIVINTQAADSADSAYSATLGPIAGPIYLGTKIPLNHISAGIGIATNIAATAKALSALGGGGSPSAGVGAGAGAAPQAQFNIVGASGTNQLASTIGKQQNQPINAYVVGSNVTTQQSLDRNKITNATFI
jgi:hypothetical protein